MHDAERGTTITNHDDYTSESIQVLEGLEAIRKRPGMYVGGVTPAALHHLVYECVDNAIDEVMAGFATTVTVLLGVDGSCTVIDDGRGMPVDPISIVRTLLAKLLRFKNFPYNLPSLPPGNINGCRARCLIVN